MNYRSSYHTDVGIKKSTNQDALLIKEAETRCGRVLFAAICDGMGGLSKGEVASAEVIRRLSDWFVNEFPVILERDWTPEDIRAAWEALIREENERISVYADRLGINMGTTLTTFLAVGSQFYTVHVGDCRLYECSDGLYQMTKDQTVVAREIERGSLTPEQAALDPRRNVLLQCIGASAEVTPDFLVGNLKQDAVYILCTDGFRHEISGEEIWNRFAPHIFRPEAARQVQMELVEEIKRRGETDNISVLTIKTC